MGSPREPAASFRHRRPKRTSWNTSCGDKDRARQSTFLITAVTCLVLGLVVSSTVVAAQRRPSSAKRRAETESGDVGAGVRANRTTSGSIVSSSSKKPDRTTTLPTPALTAGSTSRGSVSPSTPTMSFSISPPTVSASALASASSQLTPSSPMPSPAAIGIGDVKKMDAVKSAAVTGPPPTVLGSQTQQLSRRVGLGPAVQGESDEDDEDEDGIESSDEDSPPSRRRTTPSIGDDKGDKAAGDDQVSQETDWRLYSTLPEQNNLSRTNSWGDRTAYTRRLLNMTRVDHIEAECQDDFMKIFIRFNGTFDGLIYSSGYSYDPDCIYINGSGKSDYEFFIQLNRCGTLGGNNHDTVDRSRNQPSKSFMWNTVTIQYNMMIEEEWDEHFKVTCEYGYDFWKTVTFPMLDVQVATGNPVVFTLTPPECHMEIRYGYGITGNRITGPVRVGDPLTLVIYMRSQYEGFDMVVNNCFAHNGAQKKIPLIDRFGCPVDEKLISSFQGTWTNDGVYETQVYAYMKAFRFTGSPALYLECEVRMCHGYCPSQPCHWRSAGRRKRELPALPSGSGSNVHGKMMTNVKSKSKSSPSSSYYPPGFFRKSRFTTGEEIEVDDAAVLGQAGANTANVTTISLFQALQVLKDVTEEPTSTTSEDRSEADGLGSSHGESPPSGLGSAQKDAAVQKRGFGTDSENFCIKTGVFTALLGVCSLMILLMATACCFLFIRMRRSSSASDKIEPHDFVAPKRRIR